MAGSSEMIRAYLSHEMQLDRQAEPSKYNTAQTEIEGTHHVWWSAQHHISHHVFAR